MKKKWTAKYLKDSKWQIKTIDRDFADMPAGSKMLIATPQIIADYLRNIPKGKSISTKTLREDLALEYNAQYTCPVTTGIFLRVVGEYAYEQFTSGIPIENIVPFWRIVTPDHPLAKKLSFGEDFLKKAIATEKT